MATLTATSGTAARRPTTPSRHLRRPHGPLLATTAALAHVAPTLADIGGGDVTSPDATACERTIGQEEKSERRAAEHTPPPRPARSGRPTRPKSCSRSMCPRIRVVGGIRRHVGRPVLATGCVRGFEPRRTLVQSDRCRIGDAPCAARVRERDPMRSHAASELEPLGSNLLDLGRRRPTPTVREQVRATPCRRLEVRVGRRETAYDGLVEPPTLGWVWKGRHAVGAHAVSEFELLSTGRVGGSR
jgi:hypothetical protein